MSQFVERNPELMEIARKIAAGYINIRSGMGQTCIASCRSVQFLYRVRDISALNYNDITFRALERDKKSEWDKIKEGHGDVLIYVIRASNGTIRKWIAINLVRAKNVGVFDLKLTITMNKDGRTGLCSVPIALFESLGCVIDKFDAVEDVQLKLWGD